LKLTADKGLNTLAFFLFLLAAVLPASAEGGQRFTAEPSAAVVQNGTEFVDKLLRSATTIGAYRVTADLAMQKKGKLSKAVAQFTFKAPSLLRLPNGLLVTGCDFASLVRWLKLQAKSGADVSVSAMPLKIDELSNVIVVELRDSGPFSTSVAQRVLVDPSRMLPIEWILFKEGALLSSTKFRNLELLPQVDESIFQL
jgi:outer membrane lipoprotein-sorting protein